MYVNVLLYLLSFLIFYL